MVSTQAAPAFDVVVVGAGNAALTAALAAHEQGAAVAILEKASRAWRGGNTRFAGGVFRAAYSGIEDVAAIVPAAAGADARNSDVGYYSEAQFYNDLMDVTEGTRTRRSRKRSCASPAPRSSG